MFDAEVFHCIAHLIRNLVRPLHRRTGQNHAKFLSAISRNQVGWTVNNIVYCSGYPPETLISMLVPVNIVIVLEVIHIHHEHGNGCLFTLRLSPFLVDKDIKVTPVGYARE